MNPDLPVEILQNLTDAINKLDAMIMAHQETIEMLKQRIEALEKLSKN